PLLVLAFVAGVGAAWLLARAPKWRVAAIVLPALALLPLASGRAGESSERDNRFCDALGRGLLAGVPRGAVLFVPGAMLHNAPLYRPEVLHERPDVIVLDEEQMSDPWYVRRVRSRWPGLLPPLDQAARIVLRDGRRLEGVVLPRSADSCDVITEDAQFTAAT